MKVLIDTDPGIDDAIALGLVLNRCDVEIIAITTVRGNINVDQGTTNVLKVLEVFGRKDVPVYKGAHSALLAFDGDAAIIHGEDGMGNVLHCEPDTTPLQEEHAVTAINRLAKQYSQQLTIIALGPLTNIAMALRLNKDLPSQTKELVIMGGNYKAIGNTTLSAEFNFYLDPVAAHIVLQDYACRKILVTWELSVQASVSQKDIATYLKGDNKRTRFFRSVFTAMNWMEQDREFCDALAVAIALDDSIVKSKYDVHATVELDGRFTRGQVVVDWEPHTERRRKPKHEINVIIPHEIDMQLFTKMLFESTS